MFHSLTQKMQWPHWASERYKRLVALTKLVEGTFYDHLQSDFYTEETHNGNYIPLVERRPAVQTMLAYEIVSHVARKLFAGRHAPKITHNDEAYLTWLNQVLAQSGLYEKFTQAMMWGAVGSVAITFRLVDGALRLDVWRPYQCMPTFDGMGALSRLRVQYTTSGAALRRLGFTKDPEGLPLDNDKGYWYIKDWTDTQEVTYYPIADGEYNPVDGPEEYLLEMPEKTFTHNFEFLPGVWVVNLPGGEGNDGMPTVNSAAAANIIDLDYTISQMGRGIRYSAAPQLVITGELSGADEQNMRRGPTSVLRLKSSWADDNLKLGASDAKLLEMVGNGTQVGLNYVDLVKKTTMNALAASVRSIETHTGTVSGRAMELIDDAFYDIINAFRASYGDGALVPLLSKIVLAYEMTGALPPEVTVRGEGLTAFGLRWPRVFSTTPADELQMVESLTMAVQNGLIDAEVAKSYINTQLDLEDYKVKTPPQTGTDAASNAPVPGEVNVDDEKYQEGINPDKRRPGPQGHTLPRRRVGGKQVTLD